MLKEAEAQKFAEEWVQAWNAHDLEAILSHYAPDVVLTSPVAAELLNDASGTVKGKDALRAYFSRGLEVHRNLAFDLREVLVGISSVVLYYQNQKGTMTGEFMELDANKKVVRVVANYGGAKKQILPS
ncbi:MAG TPA: nuclear transport factor 2 family protein [Terriglobia bacterium]|nr:nuclear transport factor 2 family protein [Terriglobia bacterium]